MTLLNCRSMIKHKSEIHDLLLNNDVDTLFLTETWLEESSSPDILEAIPPNYCLLRIDRYKQRGGGLALICKKELECTLQTKTITNSECGVFSIKLDASNTITALLIYRPPGSLGLFCDQLIEATTQLAIRHKNLMILGDLNLHFEDINAKEAQTLKTALNSLGLKLLSTNPTHQHGHLLDPIFASWEGIDIFPPIPLIWSDHYMINFEIPISLTMPVPPKTYSLKRRNWKNYTPERFKSSLDEQPLVMGQSLQETWNNYELWQSKALDKIAPWTTKPPVRRRKSEPWFTEKLQLAKAQCKSVERKWRKSYTPELKKEYTTKLKEYHKLIREEKSAFFKNRVEEANNPRKEMFCIFKELTNSSRLDTQDTYSSEICEQIADYFVEKVEKIHSTFTKSTNLTNTNVPIKAPCTHNLTLNKFITPDRKDLLKIINGIHSGSPNDVCPQKRSKDIMESTLINHISYMVTLSFQECLVPEAWKLAQVIPLKKKPNIPISQLKNLRPISLLPYCAKIIEKIVNKQLMAFLEGETLLHPSQSGFRPGYSTESAVLYSTEYIRKMVDEGETAALVMLDLSAAFDTVLHTTLLSRLSDLGVTGTALAWMESFLTDRSFQLHCPPFKSSPRSVNHGVPQGSSLSPTLFNIYMEPLAHVVENFGVGIVSYADDTQLMFKLTPDSKDYAANFSNCMAAVATWMDNNCLRLNGDKTEVLVVGKDETSIWSHAWWPSELGELPSPVKSVRNLGIMLDSDLSGKSQVNKTTGICFGTLKVLRKIIDLIPIKARKALVHALITPHLDYGNALLIGLNQKGLHQLQCIQNAAARMVLGLPRRTSTKAALTKLHWLPVKERIRFKSLCYAHRIAHNKGPTYLRSLLTIHCPLRDLRSSGMMQFKLPRITRAKMGGKSFRFLATKYWNALPLPLRMEPSETLFRAKLKTLLFPK
ncbi:uncharacterized protein LOC144827815 [Lissotriton helveticus]